METKSKVNDSHDALEPQTFPWGQPSAKVTAEQGVNLRGGPGTEFEIYGILPKDAVVHLLTFWAYGPQGEFEVHINGWSYIFANDMVGWVDSRYLLRLESNDV